MNTIIVLLGLVVLVAVIYKLLNHSDKTPDPLDKLETEANAKLEEALAKAATAPVVVETDTETSKTITKPENMTDAEWAISDKNPNKVQVAPVVVTADAPTAPEAAPEVAPVKKPRAKKAAAPKAEKVPKAPKKTK